MTHRILAINPGSTSTKIAVYDNTNLVFETTLRHSAEELSPFATIIDQQDFRKHVILKTLSEHNVTIASLNAIAGRGGLLHPLPSGTFAVNEAMLFDLRSAKYGNHASNLGAILAYELASEEQLPSFIVDPVVVDELAPLARLTGLPGYERTCIWHALNQKAVARRVAKQMDQRYEDLNLIVAHLGGGISIGAHEGGKVIDVNNALLGDGPYTPERAGGMPVAAMLSLCFSGKTEAEVKKMIAGKGGLVAYLSTNDGREVQRRIREGDMHAKAIYEGMAYQIAKEIGSCATVLKGNIDAVILTGGLAYDQLLVGWIKERVSFLGEVIVVGGEDELLALSEGVLRVLQGHEEARQYISS